MKKPWFRDLQAYVENKPIVILRLADYEMEQLRWSGHAIRTFTKALQHEAFHRYQAPAVCLVLAEWDDQEQLFLAQMGPRRAITTFESRAKVKDALPIEPTTLQALARLLENRTHKRTLSARIPPPGGFSVLSPGLSGHIIERLATVEANGPAMRKLSATLTQPRHRRINSILQEDAIRTALKVFNRDPDAAAVVLDLPRAADTSLVRVHITEDGVIEHDARQVPGYQLASSDVTGRAVFHSGAERLEVITANRRMLEEALGVDLIYLNLTRRNMVLLQYKMLESPSGKSTDWIYRPDAQFAKELLRMRAFTTQHAPGPSEYRLNPAAFYLKFVKRDAALRTGRIVIPLDHYDRYAKSAAAKGAKGGVRVSFDALGGSYLREAPFIDLIRAGYIGSYADTTTHLTAVVNAILKRGRAIVAAWHRSRQDTRLT